MGLCSSQTPATAANIHAVPITAVPVVDSFIAHMYSTTGDMGINMDTGRISYGLYCGKGMHIEWFCIKCIFDNTKTFNLLKNVKTIIAINVVIAKILC